LGTDSLFLFSLPFIGDTSNLNINNRHEDNIINAAGSRLFIKDIASIVPMKIK
jgi:hypothetical protein